MRWKDVRLAGKFAWGFGLVLLLLVIVGGWSIIGIGGITGSAEEVIEGNKLRGEMLQKELDHLNWANQVNALLTDDAVTELNVQTDPHKCGFGKWYYGDGRKQAEHLVPALKADLAAIEEPHKKLHQSAAELGSAFKQSHQGLAETLAARLKEHVSWVSKVAEELSVEAGTLYAYQTQVKNAVDQATSIIEAYASDTTLGDTRARRAAAIKALRAIRYGSQGTDYLWIQATDAHMVMHPIKPALEGRDLTDFKDANNKKFFIELTNIAKSEGAGFVTYVWPKPGSDAPVSKISYGKLYKPWGLIVATGVYLDENNAALLARAEEFAKGTPFAFSVQKDSTKCAFGKYLDNPKTHELEGEFPEFKKAIDACRAPHKKLHGLAVKIENKIADLDLEGAVAILSGDMKAVLIEVQGHFNAAITAESDLRAGAAKAAGIYANTTVPNLDMVKSLLGKLINTAGENIMTDDQMLSEASTTRSMIIAISLFALPLGIFLAFVIAKGIVTPLGQTVQMIEEMEKGHITTRLNVDRKDEIGMMAASMDSFADSLQNEVVANLQKLAAGDLTFDVTPQDEQDELRNAIKALGSDLNEIFGQIQVASEQIASGSCQVSDSSQSLSQGATEQASSLEEISASLNQLSSQTTNNAENANQANGLATEARTAAQKGSEQMESMVSAMSEINEAGQNISKIIKTIDEIAFQTNLLALNAAVEAARAGQHGKGFAVVAEEVRNLAARSAKAAEETSELIKGSVEKTENGSAIANQTAEALQDIVTGISKASDLVAEIAAASSEQAQGVSQINQGVTQIDQVTQQNTASAEECAAASEELSGQAEQMRQMLQRFSLKNASGRNLATPR